MKIQIMKLHAIFMYYKVTLYFICLQIMPIQRKERIIILGLGTLGFILTVVGAGFDYWLDGNFFYYSHITPIGLGIYVD